MVEDLPTLCKLLLFIVYWNSGPVRALVEDSPCNFSRRLTLTSVGLYYDPTNTRFT